MQGIKVFFRSGRDIFFGLAGLLTLNATLYCLWPNAGTMLWRHLLVTGLYALSWLSLGNTWLIRGKVRHAGLYLFFGALLTCLVALAFGMGAGSGCLLVLAFLAIAF